MVDNSIVPLSPTPHSLHPHPTPTVGVFMIFTYSYRIGGSMVSLHGHMAVVFMVFRHSHSVGMGWGGGFTHTHLVRGWGFVVFTYSHMAVV